MDVDQFLTLGFLDGLGTVGTWALLGMFLVTGRGLALSREVKQRDETIEWQRHTIREQNEQIIQLVSGTKVAATALRKVSDAAVEAGGGL